MITPDDVLKVADQLASVVRSNDGPGFSALCSPNASIWDNVTRAERSPSELHARLDLLAQVGACEFDVVHQFPSEVGFVQIGVLRYLLSSGGQAEVPVAIIAWVGDDGLIERVEEFLNLGDYQPVLQALEPFLK